MSKSTHLQISRIRQILFRHKKRMVSSSFPSPHLVWSSFRWNPFHNSKQAQRRNKAESMRSCIGTNAGFDAIRSHGANVRTNSGAQLASGSSVLNEELILRWSGLPRNRRRRLATARQPLRSNATIETNADG